MGWMDEDGVEDEMQEEEEEGGELTTTKKTTRVDWLLGVDGWRWERSKGLQCPSFA